MSGYLQRLARSVMQPAEKIHPMVGSIYAPQPALPERDMAETSVAMETERTPLNAPINAPREFGQEKSPIEGRIIALTSPTPVVVPRPPRRETMTAAERVPNLFPRESAPLASPVNKQNEVEDFPVAQASRGMVGDKYLPLMTRPLMARPSQTSDKRVPQLLASATMPLKRKPQSGGAEPGSRHEPDEIQIHIGRIEVLAVPQTPPPSRTKTSPAAPNLADYLRKRDGRAQ